MSQSSDDIFIDSSTSNDYFTFSSSSPKSIISMKCGQELAHDALCSSLCPTKSASFSISENGDSDRNKHGIRKPSVLDEKALREDDTVLVRDQRIETISRSYQVILESIGEDPLRQGLLKTPKRAAE
ncbi:unnamed protein product, partial [Rotaria magnacalcarata]